MQLSKIRISIRILGLIWEELDFYIDPFSVSARACCIVFHNMHIRNFKIRYHQTIPKIMKHAYMILMRFLVVLVFGIVIKFPDNKWSRILGGRHLWGGKGSAFWLKERRFGSRHAIVDDTRRVLAVEFWEGKGQKDQKLGASTHHLRLPVLFFDFLEIVKRISFSDSFANAWFCRSACKSNWSEEFLEEFVISHTNTHHT